MTTVQTISDEGRLGKQFGRAYLIAHDELLAFAAMERPTGTPPSP